MKKLLHKPQFIADSIQALGCSHFNHYYTIAPQAVTPTLAIIAVKRAAGGKEKNFN